MTFLRHSVIRRVPASIALLASLAACRSTATLAPSEVRPVSVPVSTPMLVPRPASLVAGTGAPFVITRGTAIVVPADSDARAVGESLARLLRPATGFPLPVVASAAAGDTSDIRLDLDAAASALGDEGYELRSSAHLLSVRAHRAAGLFHGIQTIRQLLPPRIESDMQMSRVDWSVPPLVITDVPRFAWRGAMLDVARHFFTVKEVEQYIDVLALYKMNVLHLHLSDDQGWRIEIRSRPLLAQVGGALQVGGRAGGFYTQAEYATLVRYAADRFITVVPEIDMPGHTNAALSAYPALSCSTRPAAPYTGTEVGWSTVCVDDEATYALVDDIVRELAAMTPGAYLHLGGDEVQALTAVQYARFVERVQDIVARYGKRMVGWEEIAGVRLRPNTLVQQWRSDSVVKALASGARIVLSPARHAYLDMKYSASTELGLSWAGYVTVRGAYDWDPATLVPGVAERDVLGVEAPLWSETVRNITAVQSLAVPRLPALAEVGWSPQASRDWDGFRARIATHAPRWRILGINYEPSAEIVW